MSFKISFKVSKVSLEEPEKTWHSPKVYDNDSVFTSYVVKCSPNFVVPSVCSVSKTQRIIGATFRTPTFNESNSYTQACTSSVYLLFSNVVILGSEDNIV